MTTSIDIIESQLTEDELNFRNLILSTQLETSMDGILVVNRKREWISYNQRFLDMWGIAPKVAAGQDSRLALASVRSLVTEPEHFLQRVEELYKNEAARSQEEIELAAYRVIQEGLTNIARHAKATLAQMHIHVTDLQLEIRIEDEGVGFDKNELSAHPNTSGLLGMSARVSLLGGELSLSSAPGQGTQLTAVIPLSGSRLNGRD